MSPAARVHQAVLYHDEPQEAGADQMVLGCFRTREQAASAIRGAQDDWWQTGSIHAGWWIPGARGRPGRFKGDERELTWYVGSDGTVEAER